MGIISLLIRHEGWEDKPYVDTVGKITIGVGRNLTDNGLSHKEILFLLENDVKRTEHELKQNFAWYKTLGRPRQMVVISMVFNVGLPRFHSFINMIKALENQDFVKAAEEMLDSKWAKQVGHRSLELANMMESGNNILLDS